MTRGAERGSRRAASALTFYVLLALPVLSPLPVILALSGATARAESPPPVGNAPAWVARRAAWIDALDARRQARWEATLPALVAAERRAAAAESLYRSALLAWTPDVSAIRVPPRVLREAALDWIAWGEAGRASGLLEGALRDDELLLPLRAAALGRTGRAAEGLSLLGWPPDRRLARGDRWRIGMGEPARGPARDVAHLLTAAALSDSVDDPRAERAALHALLRSTAAGPAARERARLRLAARYLSDRTPRLAVELLAEPTSGPLALALGSAYAASGDTLGAIGALTRFGTRAGASVSERYPALLQAASWAGGYADRVEDGTFLSLCRTLGEVGESDRGLSLLRTRKHAAADSRAKYARAEVEAALLARGKHYAEAFSAYRALAAWPGKSAVDHARIALAVARAARSGGTFATTDSAFQAAAALDPAGGVGEQAAWERAREWEDQRDAPGAASVFTWAFAYLRSPSLQAAGRVHGALAWKRAGVPDSARALLAPAPRSDALGLYWRGVVALAAGDTATALESYRAASAAAPLAYEGIRAREESARLGAPLPPPEAPERVAGAKAAERDAEPDEEVIEERVLTALGYDAIAADRRMRCAREGADGRARGCTDELEEAGVFRVGQRSLLPAERLEYPPAYPSAVLRAAEAESIAPALVWGIMRQESAYDRRARSKAGALGLLQLLPKTASQLAGRPVVEDSLADAALNVRLGARYVRALLKEFGDPRAVLASYNAGEDVVRRWKRDRPMIDDEWVERIPYRETRDYVKQVYAAWRRYETIYGIASDGVPR